MSNSILLHGENQLVKTHKWYSDRNAVKFQVDIGFKKLNKFSKRRQVWNFDNPQDWDTCGFKTLTSNDSALQEIWHDSGSVERQRHYKYWNSRINSILHKLCFQKIGLSLSNRCTQRNSGVIFLRGRKLRPHSHDAGMTWKRHHCSGTTLLRRGYYDHKVSGVSLLLNIPKAKKRKITSAE